MTVSIQRRRTISRVKGVPTTPSLRRRMTLMLRALQMPKAEVSILLTDDDEIQILNREYRSIDRPTDVLSFSLLEGEGARFAGDALGDLVVSITTAARQAREAKRPLIDELTMLLAHGLLHLLGWDHRTTTEDRRMRAETDALCVAAGAPPLFALGGVDARGRSRPTREATKKAPPRRKSKPAER